MKTSSWRLREQANLAKSSDLEEKYGKLLGRCLAARGFSEVSQLEKFLDPRLEDLNSPFLIPRLKNSVERLAQAIIANEKIGIYADYDMDGTAGLAIVVHFLRDIGFSNFIYYQPHRFEEGYGVHPHVIEKWASEGVKVVVTVDTGSSAVEACEVAQKHGIDFVVTDHHLVTGKPASTPFLVNPNVDFGDSQKSLEAHRSLSGTGMAFVVCLGIRAELRQKKYFEKLGIPQPDIREYLDLFVLGTVADVVNLNGDNRSLVKAGMSRMLRQPRLGIKSLFEQMGVEEPLHWSVRDIAFSLTPKFNAASRLGQVDLSTKLLLSQDGLEAKQLAEDVLRLNEERTRIQVEVLNQAKNILNEKPESFLKPVLFVFGDWHEGVLGIVAAKLVDEFLRPTIVCTRLKNGNLRGSMRAPKGFECLEVLEPLRECMKKFGGHAQAAGLEILKDKIQDFENLLNDSPLNENLMARESILEFDGDLPDSITMEDIQKLDSLEPCGPGNPEALFRVKIPLNDLSVLKERHVKGVVQGMEVIGFFKWQEIVRLREESQCQNFVEALVVPSLNRYRGRQRIQLRMEHVRKIHDEDSNFRS